MKPEQRIANIRKCFAALKDIHVRNLMEHAANKTPVILDKDVRYFYQRAGAGCPAALAGFRGKPENVYGAIRTTNSALSTMQEALHEYASCPYYDTFEGLDVRTFRRLAIEEGKRRGYVLEDV